jgi:hypothetical protein
LLPPPVIEDSDKFNGELLACCTEDLQRGQTAKKEQICDLSAKEQEALIPLPNEHFRVFTLEKVKTDKYSFIQFGKNRYSAWPQYAECETRLETGTSELRILNKKYGQTAVHTKEYGGEIQPAIDFEHYIGALGRKPRAFLNSPYFPALPIPVQDFLKKCSVPELKKMLPSLVPIIRGGKIGGASAVLELAEIKNAGDFCVAGPRTDGRHQTA